MLTYIDHLDALTAPDSDDSHERAKRFVANACEIATLLQAMDTPTDGVTDQDDADDIMSDLDDDTLCSDASELYELIRMARECM